MPSPIPSFDLVGPHYALADLTRAEDKRILYVYKGEVTEQEATKAIPKYAEILNMAESQLTLVRLFPVDGRGAKP